MKIPRKFLAAGFGILALALLAVLIYWRQNHPKACVELNPAEKFRFEASRKEALLLELLQMLLGGDLEAIELTTIPAKQEWRES